MTAAPDLGTQRPTEARHGRQVVVALCVLDGLLMVASGLIHLHLWNIAYRHVTTGHLNVLFLVQTIAAFVGAIALVALRRLIVVAGSAALMVGTIGGFLLARYRAAGLFGFKLPYSTSDAKWALAVEIAAAILLSITAGTMARAAHARS
jgi:hypothetical protein